jgi:hypothetical protein
MIPGVFVSLSLVKRQIYMKKECSIIFYEGWVNVAPTIISLAKTLFDKSYMVTVFCRQPQLEINNESEPLKGFASVIYFNHSSNIYFFKYCFDLLRIFKLGTTIPSIDALIFAWQIRMYKLKYKLGLKYQELIIGVDTNGSIVALVESLFLRTKNLAYLSLELSRKEHFRYFDRVRYFLEKVAYRKSICLIIQDEYRFKHITKYMQFDREKIFYLPNCDSSKSIEKLDVSYFQKMFELNNESYPYIILQAGMICDEVFSKELARSFNSINIGCALIFHEREKKNLDDPYLQSLKDINSKNLFLSLNPVIYKDIHKVFTSTNIGLACYRDIDENFSEISKASGKLSFYLKYGKPVIMNNIPSLRRLNDRYQVGKIVEDLSNYLEIESAIEEIMGNYAYFSKNALYCFDKEFDFKLTADLLLDFLDSKTYM